MNDNPFVDEANGGMHWTLLSYSRSDRTFSHYDSGSGSGNESAARGIAAKLKPVLGCVPHCAHAYVGCCSDSMCPADIPFALLIRFTSAQLRLQL